MERLHAIALCQKAAFKLPLIGEPFIRNCQKAAARGFYYLPFVGGTKCRDIPELRENWMKFLNRFGIQATVTSENEGEFHWFVKECPYGLKAEKDRSFCDALMDLDRTYIGLLGGELEITHRIPNGDDCCRFVTRL